jgi:hypothetical protein
MVFNFFCLVLIFFINFNCCSKRGIENSVLSDKNSESNNNNHLQNNDSNFSAPNKNENIEIIKNYDMWQLEIYATRDGARRLLSSISYDDFDYRNKIVISKNYLLCNNYDDTELMGYNFSTGLFSSIDIPSGQAFDISKDEKYICVSVENNKLTGFLKTDLPCLYDFQERRIIKEYYFDFLEDEIGISLEIRYDEENNRMDINYYWDTPVPQFSGYIYLENNFEFVRIK